MAKQKGSRKQGRNKKRCELYKSLGRRERNAKLRQARHKARLARKASHMKDRKDRAMHLPADHPDCPTIGKREYRRWHQPVAA